MDSTSYEGPDSGAKNMKFAPKKEEPVAQTQDAKQVQDPTKKTQSSSSAVPRTVNETLKLVKTVVREHINNTLGNLKARETISKKRRRPLAASTAYSRYKSIKEEMDKAEETETRAEKTKDMPLVRPSKDSTEKPNIRRKVPGPNLAPENLSIN